MNALRPTPDVAAAAVRRTPSVRGGRRSARAVVAAGVALLALTACVADDGGPAAGPVETPGGDSAAEAPSTLEAPAPDGGATGGDAAARFVACLAARGVHAQVGGFLDASVDDLVFVQIDPTPVAEGIGSVRQGGAAVDETDQRRHLLTQVSGEAGSWMAVTSAAHFESVNLLDIADAYAACEAAHPYFAQGEIRRDTENEGRAIAQNMAANLPFAQAARAAGLAWVADPSEGDLGAILLPAALTEGDFRALIELAVEGGHELVTFRITPDVAVGLGFNPDGVIEQIAGPRAQLGVVVF